MLNIKKFVCNMFQENCYIVNDETNECIIIDCGANNNIEEENIKNYISNNKLKPCHLLCTHAHIDHNFGNEFIFNLYGLKPTVCKEDKFLFAKLSEQAKSFIGKLTTVTALYLAIIHSSLYQHQDILPVLYSFIVKMKIRHFREILFSE